MYVWEIKKNQVIYTELKLLLISMKGRKKGNNFLPMEQKNWVIRGYLFELPEKRLNAFVSPKFLMTYSYYIASEAATLLIVL